MKYSFLPNRGVIQLSGDDRFSFLQGIISNDVRKLEQGQTLYAALLSPQGKFLHDFFLYPHGESVLLDAEADRLEDLLKRLKLYKLRAKVSFEPKLDLCVAAAFCHSDRTKRAEESHHTSGDPSASLGMTENNIFTDPRTEKLGVRLIGTQDDIRAQLRGAEEAEFAEYDRLRIEQVVPDGSRDMTVDKALLLENHFERLHGVDFAKGCYIGQEVTARMKYRANVKKQLYGLRAISGQMPAFDTPVLMGDKEIGTMRSSAVDIGLALLKAEEGQELMGAQVQAGHAIATVFLPQKGVK